MRTSILVLLAGLSLAPAVHASSCATLAYQNQCQGSNKWPVPTGWQADSDGDCQPQAPDSLSPSVTTAQVLWQHGGYSNHTGHLSVGACESAWWADWRRVWGTWYCYTASDNPHTGPGGMGRGFTLACGAGGGNGCTSYCAAPAVSLGAGLGCGVRSCPAGYTLTTSSTDPARDASGYVCTGFASAKMKPSDGVCTTRWTSAAMGNAQEDPLDPDCTGACVCASGLAWSSVLSQCACPL